MSFTPEEIIESKKVHGDDILFGLSESRKMNLYEKPGTDFRVAYFTLVFKGPDGEFKPATMRIDRQIIFGRCKLPEGNLGNGPKTVSFPFSKYKRQDIEGGDYSKPEYPKGATDAIKERIDKVYEKNISRIEKDNDTMFKAMNIISDEFVRFMKKERLDKKYKAINLISDCDNYHIKKPYATRTRSGEELEFRLYRIHIPFVIPGRHNGDRMYANRIGRYNSRYGFTSLIKDKFGKEAKIKKKTSKGKIRYSNITKDNIDLYMTRKSLISGDISFSNVSASSQGINLKFEVFRPISVNRHKSRSSQESMTQERLNDLADREGFAKVESDDEEEMPNIDSDNGEEETVKLRVEPEENDIDDEDNDDEEDEEDNEEEGNDKDDDGEDDEEEEEDDDEDDEEEVVVVKKKNTKKKSSKSSKKSKPKKKISLKNK